MSDQPEVVEQVAETVEEETPAEEVKEGIDRAPLRVCYVA